MLKLMLKDYKSLDYGILHDWENKDEKSCNLQYFRCYAFSIFHILYCTCRITCLAATVFISINIVQDLKVVAECSLHYFKYEPSTHNIWKKQPFLFQ